MVLSSLLHIRTEKHIEGGGMSMQCRYHVRERRYNKQNAKPVTLEGISSKQLQELATENSYLQYTCELVMKSTALTMCQL